MGSSTGSGTFGTHDGYTLWEAPDNVSMAAVALAISGGGALSLNPPLQRWSSVRVMQ